MRFLYRYNTDNKVLILGDIHGNFDLVSGLLPSFKPEVILQVGDFGYYPDYSFFNNGIEQLSNTLEAHNCNLYFLDGNHEDHKTLLVQQKNKKKSIEIAKNIYYQPRASLLTLPQVGDILFVGGAKSVDWKSRKLGEDWFTEEVLTEKDIKNLPKKVDLILSHTAPQSLMLPRIDDLSENEKQSKEVFYHWDLSEDPSRAVLDIVYNKVETPIWCFGHFHDRYCFKDTQLGNAKHTTTFIGLDCVS